MQGFQPNQQFQPGPQAQTVQAPVLPDKIKGHRGIYTPERMTEVCVTLAHSNNLIGKSFNNPAKPAEVPPTAPDFASWSVVTGKIEDLGKRYAKLHEERAKIEKEAAKQSRAPRSTDGNLVFFCKSLSNLIEISGIYHSPAHQDKDGNPVPARNYKFPEQGGVTFAARPIATSVINALVDHYGTKHPVENSYFHVDTPELSAVFTPEIIEMLAKSKPKSQTEEAKRKKAEKEKKNPSAKKKTTKPRDTGPRAKMMVKVDNNGAVIEPAREIPYVNTTAITTLQGYLFLSVNPRNISDADRQMLAETSEHFKRVTTERRARQNAIKKANKAKGKTTKVAQTIAQAPPMTFQVLQVNSQFTPTAQVGPAGNVTFQAAQAAPAQTQATTAQAQGFPAGFAPAPGVSFNPNSNN